MAGFQTHITTSTALGVVYAGVGHLVLDIPPATCVLAAGLCSVSGMLPDLDSDSGVPVRETMTFAAAVVPMLMMDRLQRLGLPPDGLVAAGGVIYLAVRFGAAGLFKRYTVHRGMWHSIPAALIAGLLAFLICSSEDMLIRGFKTGAVVCGFMSHLVLDEIWSVRVRWTGVRLKKSSGTALKLWGSSGWGNFSTYAKLILLALLAVGDPVMMEHFGYHAPPIPRMAHQQWQDRWGDFSGAAQMPAGTELSQPMPVNEQTSPQQPSSVYPAAAPDSPASAPGVVPLDQRLRDAVRF